MEMTETPKAIHNEIRIEMSVARVQKPHSSLVQFRTMCVYFDCPLCAQTKKLMSLQKTKDIWWCGLCQHAVCSDCALKAVIMDHRCPFCRTNWRQPPIEDDDATVTVTPVQLSPEPRQQEIVSVNLEPPYTGILQRRRRVTASRGHFQSPPGTPRPNQEVGMISLSEAVARYNAIGDSTRRQENHT